jgi:hypothetical protein
VPSSRAYCSFDSDAARAKVQLKLLRMPAIQTSRKLFVLLLKPKLQLQPKLLLKPRLLITEQTWRLFHRNKLQFFRRQRRQRRQQRRQRKQRQRRRQRLLLFQFCMCPGFVRRSATQLYAPACCVYCGSLLQLQGGAGLRSKCGVCC